MKIGIDISQLVYEGTGVSTYVREMVQALLARDTQNSYLLFGSSFRRRNILHAFCQSLKQKGYIFSYRIFPLPPILLDVLWNWLHVFPVEWFIGKIDAFWSSDWTQPPLGRVKGFTTIHDVSFLRYPESFPESMRAVQKRRLMYAKKECSFFLCDSEATKRDVREFLHIPDNKLLVVYPGFHLHV